MEYRYSIAIYPPLVAMNLVADMKHQLSEKIGWFNSKNSKAHITICEFIADDHKEINRIEAQLRKICNSQFPFDLFFDNIGTYPNGTICILPDADSTNKLSNVMKAIQQNLKVRSARKSNSPHMSIARKLNNDNLALANKRFNKVEMGFYCDRVVLRVFNSEKGQYDVINEFLFQGMPNLEEQLTLF